MVADGLGHPDGTAPVEIDHRPVARGAADRRCAGGADEEVPADDPIRIAGRPRLDPEGLSGVGPRRHLEGPLDENPREALLPQGVPADAESLGMLGGGRLQKLEERSGGEPWEGGVAPSRPLEDPDLPPFRFVGHGGTF